MLRRVFADRRRVLEIGSGTGQHAVYFATELRHLAWQTSDLPENHSGIAAWISDAGVANALAPLALDVTARNWPPAVCDAIFSANTLHILSWNGVERLFGGVSRLLPQGGVLAVYGPFNYRGRYTSESNARFDAWLKARDRDSGIRDFETVDALAAAIGLSLLEDDAMPANNRMLVWRRTGGPG